MPNKLLVIELKGKQHRWSFEFYGDPKYIPEWEKDGLTVYEIENVIPMWVVDLGLIRIWVILQDLFNFKNPWRRK